MSQGAKTPLRRAQLIAPFGPGAMVVVRGGTSLIAAGLDHWFEREGQDGQIDVEEFRIPEWRLEQLLGVSDFRLPPDYRVPRPGDNSSNTYLTVPFLRFPQWHFCPSCHLLQEFPLSRRGSVKCPECEANRKKKTMYQVPIIAMCDHGHLMDFPWREWVHRTARPSCMGTFRLVATGSASLSGQKVSCSCGATRTLSQITEAYNNGQETHLSNNLQEGELFLCSGSKPWLGTGAKDSCSRPLRASLRSASNVYFAQVRSAIYLPRGSHQQEKELVAVLEKPPCSTLISVLRSLKIEASTICSQLRSKHAALLGAYSDELVLHALELIDGGRSDIVQCLEMQTEDSPEQSLRRAEFDTLRTDRDEPDLRVKSIPLDLYQKVVSRYFSRVVLVDKLRETRALTGFTRVFAESDQPLEQLQSMLWRTPPQHGAAWLPAYTVYGEGILLELDEALLQRWEHQDIVSQRTDSLVKTYNALRQARHLRERIISPRFLMIHTLAHLIMNRLTFECGYSSAALRERLYVCDIKGAQMAALLIYTADGDAEGTLGGLVRMGKPGYLEPVLQRALEGAQWCSADPVCTEMGDRGGQGPESCNLAACHNCALVPETACEEFNKFLDRAMVVGNLNKPNMGFFKLAEDRNHE
jgi:hypothetical protein